MEFLFFMFIMSPVMTKIFEKYGRGTKGKTVAALFLATVLLAFMGKELMNSAKTNYYMVLNVDKETPMSELKQVYHRMALETHPDKNPGDPQATEKFNLVRAAYEVLSDPVKRVLYERFGEDGVRQFLSKPDDFTAKLLHIAMHYIMSSAFIFVFSINKARQQSRQYIFPTMFFVFVLDVRMRIDGFDFLVGLSPRTTIFEKTHYLQQLVAAACQGAIIFSEFTFEDREAVMQREFQMLWMKQKQLLDKLQQQLTPDQVKQVEEAVSAVKAADTAARTGHAQAKHSQGRPRGGAAKIQAKMVEKKQKSGLPQIPTQFYIIGLIIFVQYITK